MNHRRRYVAFGLDQIHPVRVPLWLVVVGAVLFIAWNVWSFL
jgi:hypothetical protein